MPLRCVTRNLGRSPAALPWLASAAADADVLFLQEVPHEALPVPETHVVLPQAASASGAWGSCRSAIVLRRDLAEHSSLSTTGTLLDHLGAYVVRLRLAVPAQEPLTLVSLHARPARYDGELQADQLPQSRSCEAGPWWSDLASAGLVALAARGPVLCAGDLNECLAWDADHAGHRCGAEFFDRLEEGGLVDLTTRDWPSERATRQAPAYQVDRVLADAGTAARVRVRDEAPAFDGLSDHAPVGFELTGLDD